MLEMLTAFTELPPLSKQVAVEISSHESTICFHLETLLYDRITSVVDSDHKVERFHFSNSSFN